MATPLYKQLIGQKKEEEEQNRRIMSPLKPNEMPEKAVATGYGGQVPGKEITRDARGTRTPPGYFGLEQSRNRLTPATAYNQAEGLRPPKPGVVPWATSIAARKAAAQEAGYPIDSGMEIITAPGLVQTRSGRVTPAKTPDSLESQVRQIFNPVYRENVLEEREETRQMSTPRATTPFRALTPSQAYVPGEVAQSRTEGIGEGVTRRITPGGGARYQFQGSPESFVETSFTPRGGGRLSVDETDFYGGEDLRGLSPEEQTARKVAQIDRTTDYMRETRNRFAGYDQVARNDRAIAAAEREQAMEEYGGELRQILKDSRDRKLTADGTRNAISALNNLYTERLGLSPQEEEAGKTARTLIAADAELEAERIRNQRYLTPRQTEDKYRVGEADLGTGLVQRVNERTGQVDYIPGAELQQYIDEYNAVKKESPELAAEIQKQAEVIFPGVNLERF